MGFNLLIKYIDGEEKIVRGVEKYELNAETKCFTYIKNRYKGFIPMSSVLFVGREFDYKNY